MNDTTYKVLDILMACFVIGVIVFGIVNGVL